MTRRLILTVASLSIAGALVVMAAPGRADGARGARDGSCGGQEFGSRGGGGPGLNCLLNNPEMAAQAGLTDEQVSQLKQQNLASQKRLTQLKANVELARLELKGLLDSDSADEAAIMAAVETVGQARTAVQKERVQQKLRLRNTIGREKLAQIRSQVRERAQGRQADRQERRGRGDKSDWRGRSDQGRGQPPWMQSDMPPPEEMESE